MRTFVAALLLAGSITAPGYAITIVCIHDTVEDISPTGEIITMDSGSVFQVMDAATVDTVQWSTAQEVIICETSRWHNGHHLFLYNLISAEDPNENVFAVKLR